MTNEKCSQCIDKVNQINKYNAAILQKNAQLKNEIEMYKEIVTQKNQVIKEKQDVISLLLGEISNAKK